MYLCDFCAALWSWQRPRIPGWHSVLSLSVSLSGFPRAIFSTLDIFSHARELHCTGRCSCLKYLLGCPVEKCIQMLTVLFSIGALEGLLTVLFLWLPGITAEGEKIGLKPDTEYIKKALSNHQ